MSSLFVHPFWWCESTQWKIKWTFEFPVLIISPVRWVMPRTLTWILLMKRSQTKILTLIFIYTIVLKLYRDCTHMYCSSVLCCMRIKYWKFYCNVFNCIVVRSVVIYWNSIVYSGSCFEYNAIIVSFSHSLSH